MIHSKLSLSEGWESVAQQPFAQETTYSESNSHARKGALRQICLSVLGVRSVSGTPRLPHSTTVGWLGFFTV